MKYAACAESTTTEKITYVCKKVSKNNLSVISISLLSVDIYICSIH